ncbi:MAG TPA: trehalose-6-phosphate synthase [Stellaceae bacterium]|nr:trehalose-6-phosphate synthase [Stellaceae bacterium]
MARTVIVSNRVHLPGERGARAGGLAMAMREAVKRTGGLWFGWSGAITEGALEARLVAAGKVTYATVDLARQDYEQYYLGYANGTLWPLLHYRLGLMAYRHEDYQGYLRVNMRMARQLQPFLQPDDLVWVHDYHLIPLGAALRALGVANRIGFFLHTPFPSIDVLSALPHHERMIEAMAAYDLVGFQTEAATDAFLGCVRACPGGEMLGRAAFALDGRRSRVSTFPIGMDAEDFARLAGQAAHSAEARRLKESLSGRNLIIGVDRLDYSKGIPQRFEAIEGLLTAYPEQRRRFNYLQITPYSRADLTQYRAFRRELEGLAGRVNGKFAEFDWSPIRYVNRSFSQQTLAGFYRAARVGLVTPLRDGMNLVAKEFVAAQDPLDPGVLVLSRFAGAAKELDAALLVNPIDATEMAAALHRALEMPRGERSERWQAMMAANRRNTLDHWRDSFLAALDGGMIASPPRLLGLGR